MIQLEDVVQIHCFLGVIEVYVGSGTANAKMTHILWAHHELQAAVLVSKQLLHHVNSYILGQGRLSV